MTKLGENIGKTAGLVIMLTVFAFVGGLTFELVVRAWDLGRGLL